MPQAPTLVLSARGLYAIPPSQPRTRTPRVLFNSPIYHQNSRSRQGYRKVVAPSAEDRPGGPARDTLRQWSDKRPGFAFGSPRCLPAGGRGGANGIPSQDTYLRVFAAIDPAAFQCVFREWVTGHRKTWETGHVALDGKTLRRSFNTATGGKAIHMVSAWLADEGLVLGQIKAAEKSNEITAIPELLRLLDVRGVTVTIDAMGCQRAIAEQLVDSGAHYALAVKENQPTLFDNVRGSRGAR